MDFDGGSGYLPGVVTGGIENTVVENVDLINNTLEGIFIGHGAQVDGLTVIDSKLNDNLNGIGISGSSTSADNIVIFNSELSSNNNHGVIIQSNASVGSVEIYDSKMNSNTYQGVMVQSGAGLTNLIIENSEMSNNMGAGLSVNAASVDTLNIIDTILNSNDDHGMLLFNATIGSLYSNGSSYDNTTKWEGVNIQGSNIGDLDFYNGSISGNSGNGLLTKTSTIDKLDIWENTISNNGESGLCLTGNITDFLWIDDNYFAGNGWEDIDLGLSSVGALNVGRETMIYGNNEFAGGAWNAIWVDSTSSFAETPIINYNWIYGPDWAIVNLGEIPLDAEYNYWGCNGGVGSSGCKLVDGAGWGASSNTDTDPWIMDQDADGIFNTNDGTDGWAWDYYIGLYDNCPDVYNPDQLDSDGDGIGDACHPTPYPPTPPAGAPGPDAGPGPSAGPGPGFGPGPLIPVIGGQLVQLPCDTECVTLELPDGSQAEFCGLCGYWVSLSEETEETIPFDMPDGASMLMGMTVVLMDPDKVVLDHVPAGATLKLGYPLTEGVDSTALTIYLYDQVKEEWVELTAEEVLDYLESYAGLPGTSILAE